MKTLQLHIDSPAQLESAATQLASLEPHLVLAFGDVSFFSTGGNPSQHLAEVMRQQLPAAQLLGCSTAGEVAGTEVHTASLTLTGVHFEQQGTRLQCASVALRAMSDSDSAGHALGQAFDDPDLKHLLVLGPGVAVNGSALVQGISKAFSGRARPTISGGLAGDGGAFLRTYTVGPEGVQHDHVVAIGFHGPALRIASSAEAGWEPFGPQRKVTHATGNVLHTLDGEPALGIYKRYLGDHAKGLPGAGLLFPFQIMGGDDDGLIRTILGIDESSGSITLAGDVKAGSTVRLMHASTDALIESAEVAARKLERTADGQGAGALAILVSCIGRRLVMGDRVDEEVEAVVALLGEGVEATGFYSNGEIAAWDFKSECRLHNQTMTITLLSEPG